MHLFLKFKWKRIRHPIDYIFKQFPTIHSIMQTQFHFPLHSNAIEQSKVNLTVFWWVIEGKQCVHRTNAWKRLLFKRRKNKETESNIWQHVCHICIIYWMFNLQIYDSPFFQVCESEHMFGMFLVTNYGVHVQCFVFHFATCFRLEEHRKNVSLID